MPKVESERAAEMVTEERLRGHAVVRVERAGNVAVILGFGREESGEGAKCPLGDSDQGFEVRESSRDIGSHGARIWRRRVRVRNGCGGGERLAWM